MLVSWSAHATAQTQPWRGREGWVWAVVGGIRTGEVLTAGVGRVELQRSRRTLRRERGARVGVNTCGRRRTSDSMIRPRPRRTTRSLWRRRSEVCMRDTPSYGTRCIRRTSKRILRARRRGGGEQRRAARAARAARANPAAHSSHSMTVPVIWKNGSPALVCQDWGLLITRLLIVSRTERRNESAREQRRWRWGWWG